MCTRVSEYTQHTRDGYHKLALSLSHYTYGVTTGTLAVIHSRKEVHPCYFLNADTYTYMHINTYVYMKVCNYVVMCTLFCMNWCTHIYICMYVCMQSMYIIM